MRWLLPLLVACKSQGTIDVEFTRDDLSCAIDDERAILYAAPDVMCTACECGGCFDTPGAVVACDGTCDDTAGVALDLSPGRWAVVFALIDPDPNVGVLQAQGCVEIDVDADGTANRMSDPAPVACVTCE